MKSKSEPRIVPMPHLNPRLMVAAIRQLQDAQVEPDVRKIEGLEHRDDCRQVVVAARTEVESKSVASFSVAQKMTTRSRMADNRCKRSWIYRICRRSNCILGSARRLGGQEKTQERKSWPRFLADIEHW